MSSVRATVNQYPPVHHEGSMISGKETILLAFSSLANYGHKQVVSR